MASTKTYLGLAIAAIVMAAATSNAEAWTRSASGSGPRGSWSSTSSGGCAGGTCSHSGSLTGPYGGTYNNAGSTTCAGGSCTHTQTLTGPQGGTINRTATYSRY
jgi:hypothetical protein